MIQQKNISNIVYNIFVFLVMCLTIIMQGGYYPNIYCISLVVFILLSIIVIKNHSILRDKIVILIIGMCLSYFIFSFFISKDTNISLIESIKVILLLYTIFVFYYKKNRETGINAIYYCGILAMVLGVLCYSNIINIPGFILNDGSNLRLQTFFQYANTAALFFGICFFISCKKYTENKKITTLIIGVLFVVSLLLTQSQGGILAFIPCVAVYIAFLTGKRKFIIGTFISIFFCGIALLIIAPVMLKSGTMLERLVSDRDAINAIINSKFLGIGVGNWSFKQYLYQSYGYYMKYIHNYFLQVALDGGIFAFVCFISAIITFYVRLIKKYLSEKSTDILFVLCTATMLLLHSLIDIDLSFGAIIIILGLLLSYAVELKPEKTFVVSNIIASSLAGICVLYMFSGIVVKMYGDYYAKKYDFTKAVKAYEFVGNTYPYDIGALTDLAFVLELNKSELINSQAYLDRAIELNDENKDYLWDKFHFNKRTKQNIDEQKELLSKIKVLAPFDKEVPSETLLSERAINSSTPLTNNLSIKEKIGQMFMISIRGVTEIDDATKQLIENIKPGGVILYEDNIKTPNQLKTLINDLQNASKIPLFIAIDHEGANLNRFNNKDGFDQYKFISDKNYYKNRADVIDIARDAGRYDGIFFNEYGINMCLGPIAETVTDPNSFMYNRSLSSDPYQLGNILEGYIDGLQKKDILSVVKHFPGYSNSHTDPHIQDVLFNYNKTEINDFILPPFKRAIGENVGGIMTSHTLVPNGLSEVVTATISPYFITNILRNQLSFDNLVITDAMDMPALTKHVNSESASILAVQAGTDIILMPQVIYKSYDTILTNVKKGGISLNRIDESVQRIIKAKEKFKIIK